MFPKKGVYTPKMDGENHGKAYYLMDDLGGNPLFLETPIWVYHIYHFYKFTWHGDGFK